MQPRSQVLSPSRLVSLSLSRSVGRVGENPGNEVVLDDVANMDVGFEAGDSGHYIPVRFIYFILYYTVKLALSCSSFNFTERNNLASANVT